MRTEKEIRTKLAKLQDAHKAMKKAGTKSEFRVGEIMALCWVLGEVDML
jgi:hypothetical protein